MESKTEKIPDQLARFPVVQYVFVGIVVLILVIAVGHLYLLSGLTTRYFGLPLWVWVQLGVIAFMLVLAWIALQVVAEATGRGV